MATYRVPVLEQFAWQEPILAQSDGTTPVPAAVKGNRYIVTGLTGPFAAVVGLSVGDIVWYDDGAWKFDRPADGWKTYNKADGAFYVFESGSWSSASVMDGLTLTGNVVSDADAIDWNLLDNNAEALTFMAGDDVMLNFDTTEGTEVLSTDAALKVNGGSLDVSAGATNVALATDAAAMTFSRDTTSILTIDSQNLAVKVDRDLTIEGDLLVKGATTTIETSQLVVEDKLITLNKGATGAAGAGDAGLEFELDGAPVGYFKTSSDGNDFLFNAPSNAFILTLDVDADSTLNMAGDLTVETEGGIINQDLTTDSATVQFAGLTLTGGIDLTDALAGGVSLTQNDATALSVDAGTFIVDTTTGDKKVLVAGTLGVTGNTSLTGDLAFTQASDIDIVSADVSALSIDSADLAGILNIDSTIGSEKVTMAGGLDVTGEINGSGVTLTGDLTLDPASVITDGTNSVTTANLQTAYDTRGQYDSDLGVMRFVDPDTYVAP